MGKVNDSPLVICVDDDAHILSSLERIFRREPYEVVTTDDPEEVLRTVETRDVRVLIADQRMPKMRGTDLLSAVQQRSPKTIGILLSGAVGLDEVGTAVKEGVIRRLVYKPWDADELRSMVRSIVDGGDEDEAAGELNRLHLLLKHQRHIAQLLQSSFDVLPFPVAILSADGARIVYANPRLALTLGSDPAELLGAASAEFFPADVCQRAHLIGQSGAGSTETTISPAGAGGTFHLQRLGRFDLPLGVMVSIEGEADAGIARKAKAALHRTHVRLNCDRMNASDLLEDLEQELQSRRPESGPLQIIIEQLPRLADPVEGFLRHLAPLLKDRNVQVTFVDPSGELRDVIARAMPAFPHRIVDRI